MKKTAFYILILLLLHSIGAVAHIGSSGIIVQKQAGTYQLLISIQPPDVVPGTARVTVFVETGRATTVQTRPVYFWSGDAGAPVPDDLQRIDGQRFEGIVWLMDSGSSSIQLTVNGPDGKAEVVVPVVSVATAQRSMPAGTGALLIVLGLLLFVMMVTIIGASLSDGTLAPSAATPANFGRKRAIGMGVGTIILVLILFGGRTWWMSEADTYMTEYLYRPLPIKASVAAANAQSQLTIRVDTTNWKRNSRRLSFMVPDHGKLMHVFLVRMPGLDALAHLHPNRLDTLTYQSTLPNLPKGKYLLYADVVYNNGFTETLTDTIAIPTPALIVAGESNRRATDRDDSYVVTTPMGRTEAGPANRVGADIAVCGQPGVKVTLSDGSTMLWESKSDEVLEAGKPYNLRFAVADASGKPAPLEPYLGMGGHAAVLRDDGSVYIHLHPVGTYSMAAEQALVNRIADTTRSFHYPSPKRFRDSIDTYLTTLRRLPDAERDKLLMAGMKMTHTMNGTTHTNMVAFPYAFPKGGRYRIWVQVKRQGKVLTGAFDADVKDPVM